MGRWESAIQKRTVEELNKLPGAKFIVNHGSVFAEAGNPDIIGCYKKRAVVIEVKNEDGELSKIQVYRLRQWRDAEALCLVVRDHTEAVRCVISGLSNWSPNG